MPPEKVPESPTDNPLPTYPELVVETVAEAMTAPDVEHPDPTFNLSETDKEEPCMLRDPTDRAPVNTVDPAVDTELPTQN